MSDEHGESEFKIEDVVKDQLARVVRYAYPGFLTCGLLAINFEKEFKEFFDSVGLTYLLFLTFTVGALIYVLYRFVIGEFFVFICVHLIHRLLTSRGFPEGTIGLVRRLGVRFSQRRDAYSYLRHLQANQKEIQYLDYVHTELHILYITGLEFLGFGIWNFYGVKFHWQFFPKNSSVYFWAGAIILLCAIAADIRSHAREARIWRSPDKQTKIIQDLKNGGFDLSDKAPERK